MNISRPLYAEVENKNGDERRVVSSGEERDAFTGVRADGAVTLPSGTSGARCA